jgi:hypothetical protein
VICLILNKKSKIWSNFYLKKKNDSILFNIFKNKSQNIQLTNKQNIRWSCQTNKIKIRSIHDFYLDRLVLFYFSCILIQYLKLNLFIIKKTKLSIKKINKLNLS